MSLGAHAGLTASFSANSLSDNPGEESRREHMDNLSRQKWILHMKARREEHIALNTERNLIKKAVTENPEIFDKKANLRFQHDWMDMMPPEADRSNVYHSQHHILSTSSSSPRHNQHPHQHHHKHPRARLSLPQNVSPPATTVRNRAYTHTHTTSSPTTAKNTELPRSNANTVAGSVTIGVGGHAAVPEMDSPMSMQDMTSSTYLPLPEPVRRRSISAIIAGTETPTPIAHNFLQHTVGIEELRNYLSDNTLSASGLPSHSAASDGHIHYPSGEPSNFSTELLAKYTHPRPPNKYKKVHGHGHGQGHDQHSGGEHAGDHNSTADSTVGGLGRAADHGEGSESESDDESEDNNTLIDSLFLVGPREDEMSEYVDSVLDEYLEMYAMPTSENGASINTISEDTTAMSNADNSNNNNSSTIDNASAAEASKDYLPRSTRSYSADSTAPLCKPPSTLKKTHPSMTPDMMFITSENPLVETDILPAFCFPRGIETTVAVLPTKVPLMSPSRRKPSPRYTNKQRILFQSKTSSGSNNCNRFVILLTNHTSTQYGICMTIPRIVTFERKNKSIKVKTCYCLTIITVYPFFSFFFQLLTEYVNMKGFCVDATSFIAKQASGDLLQYELRQLESFAMKLIRHAIPPPGQSLMFSFTMNMIRQEVLLKRLLIGNRTEENCVGTLLWALPILLKNFELDLILEVIGCLLTEMKVVIRSKNLEILSACILSFVYLLRPLKWVCPTIVILPASMHDFLDSPVPLILGVESTPPSFHMSSGLIVVDPEQKVIHWHPSDLVTKKALTLPKVTRLTQQLKPLMENILKLTKKLKKKKILAFSVNELNGTASNKNSNNNTNSTISKDNLNLSNAPSGDLIYYSNSSDSDEPVDTTHTRPVSMPPPKTNNIFPNVSVNEDDYVQSPLLASAIATFSTTVSQHMQKIIYTAIHMKWKLQQMKQQQKIDLANVPREPQSIASRHVASDESINSDASTIFSNDNSGGVVTNSAPPPPPGAVYFTQPDLGSGGVTFMQSFIQSQMFCNYLQQEEEKEEKIAKAKKREQDRENRRRREEQVSVLGDEEKGGEVFDHEEELSILDHEGVDDDWDVHSNTNSNLPLNSLRSNFRVTPRMDSASPLHLLSDDAIAYAHLMNNHMDSPRKDPLISLFSVILTGSYPMEQNQVDDLFSKYERVYAKAEEDMEKEKEEEGERERAHSDVYVSEQRPETDTDTYPVSPKGARTSSPPNRYPVFIEDTSQIESALLCNGRCGGVANTPSCTNICLELWEQKAQQLRRQASIVDIIRRRGSSMTPGTKKTGLSSASPPHQHAHGSTKVKIPSGSLLGVDLYRNALPKRHKRETIGQYTHRTSLITGRSEEDILEELQFVSDGSLMTSGSAVSLHSNSHPQPHSHSQSSGLAQSHSHSTLLLPSASSHSFHSAQTHLLPRHFPTREHGPETNTNTMAQSHLPGEGNGHHINKPVPAKKLSPAVLAIAQNMRNKRRLKLQQAQRRRWFAEHLVLEKAAVLIQKEFRGYIVRGNIAIIISSLLQRKQRALDLRRESVDTVGSLSVLDGETGSGHDSSQVSSATNTDNDEDAFDDEQTIAREEKDKRHDMHSTHRRDSGEGSVDDVVGRKDSDDTESMLHQSDHQYFADYLLSQDPDDIGSKQNKSKNKHFGRKHSNDQHRDSEDSKKSFVRSSTYSEPHSPTAAGDSPSSQNNKDFRHSNSNGFLLDGLLPAGRRDKKGSLSLSPSSVFIRGRAKISEGAKKQSASVTASTDSSEAIRRSHSDGCFNSKDSSDPTTISGGDDRAPLTSEQRKNSFSRMLSGLSVDTNVESTWSRSDTFGDDDDDDVGYFDTLSPQVKTPPAAIMPAMSEEDTSDSLMFDEALLNEDGVPLPVYSLGPRAGDILSQPQQKSVVTLWELLRSGILVLKHGRSGRPKHRTLYCDDNLQVLYWRDGDTTGAPTEYQPHHHELEKGKATRRSSFNVFSRMESRREVVLRDVLEVRGDMSTDVMKRSIARKYLQQDQSHASQSHSQLHSATTSSGSQSSAHTAQVISLLLKDRTLDFEVNEKQWGPVYNALQIIVEFYQKQVQLLDKR